jgi:hypothetical protein
MSVLVLQRIPSEVLVHILEIVGKSIYISRSHHTRFPPGREVFEGHSLRKTLKSISSGVLGMQVISSVFDRLCPCSWATHQGVFIGSANVEVYKFSRVGCRHTTSSGDPPSPRGIRMPMLAPNRRGRHRGELWFRLEESPISPHLQPTFESEWCFPVFRRNGSMVAISAP